MKINPYIPIVIGVISVSLSAIFVKLVEAEASVIAFYRMLFTVLLMMPLFLVKYRTELHTLSQRDWFFSAIAGIFLAFHFILWFESLNYTSVASSTVLVTMQPLFAFIGTYLFFKEKITLQTFIAALIAIVGSCLIGVGDFRASGEALYGDALALAACALITGYLLFGQHVRQHVSLVTYTTIVYSASAITLFVYMLIKGDSFTPYSTETWLLFLLLAVVPNLLGHTLFNWAVAYVSTNVISIAILFEPVGAAIAAYFIFGETISVLQALGAAIILIGITLFVVDLKSFKKFF